MCCDGTDFPSPRLAVRVRFGGYEVPSCKRTPIHLFHDYRTRGRNPAIVPGCACRTDSVPSNHLRVRGAPRQTQGLLRRRTALEGRKMSPNCLSSRFLVPRAIIRMSRHAPDDYCPPAMPALAVTGRRTMRAKGISWLLWTLGRRLGTFRRTHSRAAAGLFRWHRAWLPNTRTRRRSRCIPLCHENRRR